MTLDRQPDFIRRHAATVIGNTDEATAAFFQISDDAARTGIKRVLEQLLHRISGALDNFTGGDLIDEVIWQAADLHAAHFTRPPFNLPAH